MSNQSPLSPLYPDVYCLAARFADKTQAGRAYEPLQQLIFEERENCDLSAYRLHITEGWHVVVLGEKPSDALHTRIEALLSRGTGVHLFAMRPDVIEYLLGRRAKAVNIAPWVEVHRDIPPEE